MFKTKAGKQKFHFQADSDVIMAENETQAKQKWFALLKKFAISDRVLRVDLNGQRMNWHGINYINRFSEHEKRKSQSFKFRVSMTW